MTKVLSKEVLRDCAEAFSSARENIVFGMGLLYRIEKERLWDNGQYSAFSEYVEGDCQISRSYASKLVQAWHHYVVEGSVSPENLEEVDVEKLYLAMRLPGNHESQVTKALTLTRQELRSSLAVNENGDEHEHNPITICSICHARLD